MNNFLEEKEKLLNGIENNTAEHWKEYYKDVPIDCIFEDLVIDINEIKRLTEENKQLKGSLQTHEILLKANVEENQRLKEQLQQKEDIINKAKEFAKGHIFQFDGDKDFDALLEILDNKGE